MQFLAACAVFAFVLMNSSLAQGQTQEGSDQSASAS
jgi:hypothetical protein